jgi:enoyl-CoA hydratase
MLNYTRDHTVEDALRFGLTWNAAMLQTTDVQIAGAAFFSKQTPVFPDPPRIQSKL